MRDERESLLVVLLRSRLFSRTYTDQSDGFSDYDFTDYPYFATCGGCGWDGPCRDTRAEAERDRWRHPNLLCRLRMWWVDRV